MDLLDKRAHAQTLIIEQGPLVVILLWHASRGQLEPCLADYGGRHEDHTAAFGDAIGDIELLQLADGTPTLLPGEPRIEHRIGSPRGPQDGSDERCYRKGAASDERSTSSALQDWQYSIQNPSWEDCCDVERGHMPPLRFRPACS